jgi:hypothetical protein
MGIHRQNLRGPSAADLNEIRTRITPPQLNQNAVLGVVVFS